MANPSTQTLSPAVPQNWTQWSIQNLPSWCGNDSGPFSTLVGLCLILQADQLSYGVDAASLARLVDQPLSPDDILPFLGIESGLPQYFGETNSAYRTRLRTRWSQWADACDGSSVVDELSYALGFSPQFVSCHLDLNVPGGGGYFGIPIYPQSKLWPFGFIVSIVLSGPIGSGAEGRSVLINDQQLSTIRYVVNARKPADWRAFEIVISTSPIAPEAYDTGAAYDSGLSFDGGSAGGASERFRSF